MSAAAYNMIACGRSGAGPAGAMHLADPARRANPGGARPMIGIA